MFLEREKTIPKQTWLDRLAICTKSGMQERNMAHDEEGSSGEKRTRVSL